MRHIGRGRAIRHSSGQRIPGGSRSKHKKGNSEFYNEKSKRTKINTHKFCSRNRVIQEWKILFLIKNLKKSFFDIQQQRGVTKTLITHTRGKFSSSIGWFGNHFLSDSKKKKTSRLIINKSKQKELIEETHCFPHKTSHQWKCAIIH